jgi:uncharacterized protein (TIGR03435 family)
MNAVIRLTAVALVVSVPAAAQTSSPASPRFEVASLKRNRSDQLFRTGVVLQPGGRVVATDLPLLEYLRTAYGFDSSQIIGAPPWADTTGYDLDARAGTSASVEQVRTMLGGLLADRFALRSHRETRRLPIYALARVSATRLGAQIRPSGPDCARPTPPPDFDAPPPPPPPPGTAGTPVGPRPQRLGRCPTAFFPGGLSARAIDMPAFAALLANFVHRPVVDRTGLAGAFDIDVSYSAEFDAASPPGVPPAAPGHPALPTAIREQLGLKLESERGPVDVLVIDSVTPPTDN